MRFPLPKTLRNRIALSHALITFVAISALAVYIGFVFFNTNYRQARKDLKKMGLMVGSALEQPLTRAVTGEGSFDMVRENLRALFQGVPEVGYSIYLPDGIPVIDDDDKLPPPADPDSAPEIWTALENDSGVAGRVRQDSQGKNVYYLAIRIREGNQTAGVLRLESPLESAEQEAWRVVTLMVIVAFIIWLLVSMAGWVVARGMTGSLVRLAEAAEGPSQEELEAGFSSPIAPQEVRRLGSAIRNKLAQLKTQAGELRTFVSNASHELRTPLTSMKLRVEALRQGAIEDPTVADRFLAEIESEIDRVSLMVNDMLDLSRIESGLKPEERGPVDLSALVEDVCDTFQTRAERGGVSLVCKIESRLPELIGNVSHLRRMLYNLVDNAIKYTPPEGKVEVSLTSAEKKDCLRLVVKDTGHGIAPSHLPHVFERFYRVEATRPRYGPSTGSGLGLPISKSIAEAHGGNIGVTSQVGKGTTFWVELPVGYHDEI